MEAVKRYLRFHTGSVALGSLIFTILGLFRFLMEAFTVSIKI